MEILFKIDKTCELKVGRQREESIRVCDMQAFEGEDV